MTIESEPHPSTGQPVGLPGDQTPAQPPGPVTLEGRYGRVERLAQRHEAALWKTVQDHDQTWTYMSYGPLSDAADFSRWFAGRLKLDRSTIANLIRLLELPAPVQDALRRAEITQGHARALLPLGDEREQIEFCRRIQREGLNVRQTEAIVQETIDSADSETSRWGGSSTATPAGLSRPRWQTTNPLSPPTFGWCAERGFAF